MIVSFTGHRLEGGKLDPIIGGIAKLITDCLVDLGATRVNSGMATGIDVMALRYARDLDIPVTAVMPWIGHPFSSGWRDHTDNYLGLLELCDRHVVVCEGEAYQPWFYQKRNEWLVDNCDVLISVWDGSAGGTANCNRYAKKVGRRTIELWNGRLW